MTRFEKARSAPRRVNDASLMCFSVAAGALIAAGIGAIVNHLLAGWMAVGGMVGVALLYLALGLFNLGSQTRRRSSAASCATTD